MHAIISMMLKNVEYRMYNLILTWIYQHSTLILAAQTFSNWKHRLMLWSKSLVNAALPSGMKVPNACSNREITKQHTFKLGKKRSKINSSNALSSTTNATTISHAKILDVAHCI